MDLNKFRHEQLEMSNERLIEHCEHQIQSMTDTCGRSHIMSVPPEITDSDVLFSELVRRFKNSL